MLDSLFALLYQIFEEAAQVVDGGAAGFVLEPITVKGG
jgi:hypothetical protein